jgi:hypothetical protein
MVAGWLPLGLACVLTVLFLLLFQASHFFGLNGARAFSILVFPLATFAAMVQPNNAPLAIILLNSQLPLYAFWMRTAEKKYLALLLNPEADGPPPSCFSFPPSHSDIYIYIASAGPP